MPASVLTNIHHERARRIRSAGLISSLKITVLFYGWKSLHLLKKPLLPVYFCSMLSTRLLPNGFLRRSAPAEPPRKTDTVIWKKTAFKSGLHHMSWIKRLMLLYLLLFWQPVPFYRLRLPFWLWIHEPWISVWSLAVKSFFPCAYTDTSFSDNLSGLHWIFSFQCWTPWIALRPEATSDLG